MVANALYLLAWLASCGSHPWVSKVSRILWICRSAAAALVLWPDKKDQSYIQIVLDQFVLNLMQICYIQICYIQFCVKIGQLCVKLDM